ncbi:MAG: hypothetical protein ACO3F7_04135, partial [Luteolibacter sp.]
MAGTPQLTAVGTPCGWMISIPQDMSATGKRRRKYFAGKTAAEKSAASLRQQHAKGIRGAMIPLALAQGSSLALGGPSLSLG